MANYPLPVKNTAYILYVGLVSQADTKLLKSAPTLASGDFKVSIDGAASANLATLPTNTPGGVFVKISLSAGEMNGDNIAITCIDAAGAEWCDQFINVQTATRGIDDLAYPGTSGRSINVDSSGNVILQATGLDNVVMSDITAVPAITGSIKSAINWLYCLARNKRTQTATTELVLKDDGTTTLGTSTKSDDGTTFSRGKYT